MIRVYSAAEQCIVILQELARQHPGLTLPAGRYGAKDRPLDRVCNFLVAELEGLKSDTGFDPSGGATKSEGAPDGKV